MNPSNQVIEVVDETALSAFRRERLSPSAILSMLRDSVQVFVRIAVGVGKSAAVDAFIAEKATFEFFDLVVYVAPSWNIINERKIVAGSTTAPVPWMTINPRPRARCGVLDREWSSLEQRGCSAYAKVQLCRTCHHYSACDWHDQLSRVADVRLVFATEQQFLNNRRFLETLIRATQSQRPLVIIDEARIVGAPMEITISEESLRMFDATLAALPKKTLTPKLRTGAQDVVRGLLRSSFDGIESFECTSVWAINFEASAIQEVGIRLFGISFEYIGFELDLFARSRRSERWKGTDGSVRFMARPSVNRHLLVLSAHLQDEHIARRLGLDQIESPFKNIRFRHSGTRIINLRNRIGAAQYFEKNAKQILETFAVLIGRNIASGRSTLLVSRKNRKEFCAEKLRAVLSAWGLEVRFVTDGYEVLPTTPDPRMIPIIHYGILGTNNFTSYESAFCLNSFYISETDLERYINEAEPERFKLGFKITSGTRMLRQVELEHPLPASADIVAIAAQYHRHLEVDPVIQAVGRVRYATLPREIVLFQMNDFHGDIDEYGDVTSIVALRDALDLPSPKEITQSIEAAKLRISRGNGLTADEAAKALGMSRRTYFRRLKTCGSAKTPNIIFLKGFWHSSGRNCLEEPAR